MRISVRGVLILASFVAGLIVAGCGGGGGGTSAVSPILVLGGCTTGTGTTSINYVTSWGTAPSTASQLIELVGADGSVSQASVLNESAGSSLTLNGINEAVYVLRATLYTGANATGTVQGVSSQAVSLCSGVTTVRTSQAVAPDTTNVAVAGPVTTSGSTVSVTQGLTLTIFPSITGQGVGAFVNQSSVTYGVTGGIGSVDTTKSPAVFSASAVSTGTLVAKYPGANSQVPFGVTVTNAASQSVWTVMVYMNAANNLDSDSLTNFLQLQAAAGIPGNCRIVVQWKQAAGLFPGSTFDGTRRYLVTYNTGSSVTSQLLQSGMTEPNGGPLDMGNVNNLTDFVSWAKTSYPAQHYCLVLWDHGSGWQPAVAGSGIVHKNAFSFDNQSTHAINVWQLPAALANNHVDIVAWDCSLMQMSEIAYELRNSTDYVVGSEESPPAAGYPYDTVFGVFRDNPNQSPAQLAHAFVDKTLAVPAYASQIITQSVVQTNKLPALSSAVNSLATSLQANEPGIAGSVDNIRTNGQRYGVNDSATWFYYDLGDVCQKLQADATVAPAVQAAAANVQSALGGAVIYEGHNSLSPGSHGLAIDLSTATNFTTLQPSYNLMDWETDTGWGNWLASQGP